MRFGTRHVLLVISLAMAAGTLSFCDGSPALLRDRRRAEHTYRQNTTVSSERAPDRNARVREAGVAVGAGEPPVKGHIGAHGIVDNLRRIHAEAVVDSERTRRAREWIDSLLSVHSVTPLHHEIECTQDLCRGIFVFPDVSSAIALARIQVPADISVAAGDPEPDGESTNVRIAVYWTDDGVSPQDLVARSSWRLER